MHPVIATIRPGYIIQHGHEIFTVVGSNKIRKAYFYILKDRQGNLSTFRREALLSLQAKGQITVTA